jgi:hypothetical protein
MSHVTEWTLSSATTCLIGPQHVWRDNVTRGAETSLGAQKEKIEWNDIERAASGDVSGKLAERAHTISGMIPYMSETKAHRCLAQHAEVLDRFCCASYN